MREEQNWDDIRYFLAVSRDGTLAGAARSLDVVHTTVGRRIDLLEQRLGAKLFTRSPTGLVLSDAGRELLPRAEAVERSVHDCARGVAGGDKKVAGTVKLATSLAFANSFLVRRLNLLHAWHPELVVELVLGAPQVDLFKREADLAVRLGSRGHSDLLARKLGVVEWSLFCSPYYSGRQRAVDDGLAGHAVVGYAGDAARTPGATWLEEHAKEARVSLRCNDLISAALAAEAGFGLALVPDICAETLHLTKAKENVVAADAWLVMHRDVQNNARVRAVADFLVDLFAHPLDTMDY